MFVVDYVSSPFPKAYKLLDTAISAGFLRHEYDMDVSAKVVSLEEVTNVPNVLIEETWQNIKNFTQIQNLNEDRLLEFANPASELCSYCENKQCKGSSKYDLNQCTPLISK